MKFIKDYFEKRKQRKLANRIAVLQEQAMIYQRNGNLREYAAVMKEIETLEEQYSD